MKRPEWIKIKNMSIVTQMRGGYGANGRKVEVTVMIMGRKS